MQMMMHNLSLCTTTIYHKRKFEPSNNGIKLVYKFKKRKRASKTTQPVGREDHMSDPIELYQALAWMHCLLLMQGASPKPETCIEKNLVRK